ncbi:MAG: beta-N-acetylhexosaminidase [Bacteroidetes bacterium]|nr:beta-N-acetylhexosaminidase [Bacteroidota bacterium]
MRVLLFVIFMTGIAALQAQPALVPAPQSVAPGKGEYHPQEVLIVFIDPALGHGEEVLAAVSWFTDMMPVKARKKARRGLVILHNKNIKMDGYTLSVTKKQIRIEASNAAGAFYALQTLRQLRTDPLVWQHDGKPFQRRQLGTLPVLTIQDTAVFRWRGMHLDESRHFFGLEFVKKYLDLMALHKMNVFHWHLTDDQGWRIEIKQYPELTRTGAWRNGSMVGRYKDNRVDSIRYGGYYTQDEIKEVVEYARRRFINVVPEIEMPGHSLAALASYPEYSCTGGTFEVAKTWGGFPDVYCPGNDAALQFLKNIVDEVIPLFPFAYFHIGGDECEKTRWKSCPKCQQRMKDKGLNTEEELQSWFVQTMETHLNDKGKILVGWDEILEGGLAPNAVVMSWRGTAGGIEAARQKHDVVMSPGKPCYFDHYQSKDSTEPVAIGGYNPVEAVYAYKPVPEDLNAEEKKHILGAQGNVWTEYMPNSKQVEYMVFPRQCALAEALWTAKPDRDYTDFVKRMQQHIVRLQMMDVRCATHILQTQTR